jgi:hypothetical protein
VFLDLHSVNWIPVNDPANQIVLTEDGTGVRHVMVDGKQVMRDRRHVSCDMASLAARVGEARARLVDLNEPGRQAAAAFENVVGSFCIGLSRHPHPIDRFAAADRQ